MMPTVIAVTRNRILGEFAVDSVRTEGSFITGGAADGGGTGGGCSELRCEFGDRGTVARVAVQSIVAPYQRIPAQDLPAGRRFRSALGTTPAESV